MCECEEVALSAAVIHTVALHYGGWGGHQVQGGGGHAGHIHLGKLLWNVYHDNNKKLR